MHRLFLFFFVSFSNASVFHFSIFTIVLVDVFFTNAWNRSVNYISVKNVTILLTDNQLFRLAHACEQSKTSEKTDESFTMNKWSVLSSLSLSLLSSSNFPFNLSVNFYFYDITKFFCCRRSTAKSIFFLELLYRICWFFCFVWCIFGALSFRNEIQAQCIKVYVWWCTWESDIKTACRKKTVTTNRISSNSKCNKSKHCKSN